MATKSEVDGLTDQVSSLQLDSEDAELEDLEEKIYNATPRELQALRRKVLRKQTLYKFDDEGLVKRIIEATKPQEQDGAGDAQADVTCFKNQIMMPTVIDAFDQLPEDLRSVWLCVICPEGDRVLVVASHKSTRVFDLEGTWICEHDSHLPGGSRSSISEVDEDSECTILDCLYNNEQEVYYIIDILCWKGVRYYKQEASTRITKVHEKLQSVPSLKQVTQSNPFRFYNLPLTPSCHKTNICKAIARASFEITGLLFFHKKSLYLPGATPLALWVETSCVSAVLDIQVHKLEYNMGDTAQGRRDWRKNRYEMKPEQCSSVHNSAYVTNFHRGAYQQGFGPGSAPFPPYHGYGPMSPFPDYSRGYANYSDGYGGYHLYSPSWNYYQQGPRRGKDKGQKKKKKSKPKQTENAEKEVEKPAAETEQSESVESGADATEVEKESND